jgi:hypothetical protein
MSIRRGLDEIVAKDIAGSLPRDGALIEIYGVVHSMHDRDIDENLRRGGISVLIVDTKSGPDDFKCTPAMPPQLCGDWPYMQWEIQNVVADHIRKNGDPNRYLMPDIIRDPQNIMEISPSAGQPVGGSGIPNLDAVATQIHALTKIEQPDIKEPQNVPVIKPTGFSM